MTALFSQVLLVLTLGLFHVVGPVPADLGVQNGSLSPVPVRPIAPGWIGRWLIRRLH